MSTGIITGTLLLAVLALPLAMLAVAAVPRTRIRVAEYLPLAPLPGLVAAVAIPHGTEIALPQSLLGLTLIHDTSGAMLLGAASLLWVAGGIWARRLVGYPSGQFVVWWLITLTGSLGVFIAADMIGFYLFYTLVSLAAYGLIVHDDTREAHRAAGLYVALALLGEAFLLVAFVLLVAATPDRSLLISDAVASLASSPWRNITLMLVVLGFGLKIGLVPLHVWMPLTYAAAPIPAAAVLSGAAVNAGVIGLIRFLPFDAALPAWGAAIAAIGLLSAFYGVAIGITQGNPKAVLAYSSVSQMGFIATVLGMGLATGNTTAPLVAAFYAMHHTLAKGGLFLALGSADMRASRYVWLVLLPAAALALGLAGLPLAGGQLAKLAAKGLLGDGLVGTLATLSAAGSTLLMLSFLHRLHAGAPPRTEISPSPSLITAWLAIAVAGLALPWIVLPATTGIPRSAALIPKDLWGALWPILVGLALAAILWPRRTNPPRIPEGDILILGERCLPAAHRLAAAFERADSALRQWPAAGTCVVLLVVLTVLALTMP